eukprot:1136101-Heterocapsa_arctica.AAC.1
MSSASYRYAARAFSRRVGQHAAWRRESSPAIAMLPARSHVACGSTHVGAELKRPIRRHSLRRVLGEPC